MQDFENDIASLPSVEELDEQLEYAKLHNRAKRREQMKREKERYLMRMRLMRILVPVCLVLIALAALVTGGIVRKKKKDADAQDFPVTVQSNDIFKNVDSEMSMMLKDNELSPGADLTADAGPEPGENPDGTKTGSPASSYSATDSPDMVPPNGEVVSSTAIVIDRESEQIIAARDYRARISPASMTKVLTLLVAAEHITDENDTFTMTREITDYGFLNDCSSAGFLENEEVTVKDLLYGTILPSGADAAVGLATYVAGSHEAFVEMMNEKLAQMGLSSTTHFTNCVGIYDENHYSTVYDMAMIMEAAMDNELCRRVLDARTHLTSLTEQHPEGILLSNWFLRRIEDKDTHGEVIGAKTGYVVQSGSCAASCCLGKDGKEYICVTGGSTSSWRCIYDHVALYQQLIPDGAASDTSDDSI